MQQNINGSVLFNRSWAEYKVGFNDLTGNYWLGNDLLSQLTLTGRYKLRFDLQRRSGTWFTFEYSTIRVLPESHNYQALAGGFSAAHNKDVFGYSGGSNSMMFTTYDRDNDMDAGNCAVKKGGGFWYNKCGWAYPNSNYNNFYWDGVYLQSSRMWLQCV